MTAMLICSVIFVRAQCNTNNATACQCPDGSSECDLLPDIHTGDDPLYISGNNGVIEYSQSGNGVEDGRLRVSVTTPNIGHGPLEVHALDIWVCGMDTFTVYPGSCPDGSSPKQLVIQRVYHKNGNTMTYYDRNAGTMTYHPSHGHMHVDDWGTYSLRYDNGDPNPLNWPIIGDGAKLAFCLMDYGTCSYYSTNNIAGPNPGHCEDNNGNVLTNSDFPNWGLGGGGYNCDPVIQGISSGYTDIYYQYLDGMYAQIPPNTCNGDYFIVVNVDPHNYFLEEDETNNIVVVPYSLTEQLPSGSNPVAEITLQGSTILCAGEDVELVANQGFTYLWSNGATTQSILTSTPGDYSVEVTTTCGTATSSLITITGSSVSAPTTSDVTIPSGQTATLNATGSGTLNWYDALTGGNWLASGNTYITPALTSTTTYYVDDSQITPGASYDLGPADNTFSAGGFFSGDQSLIFDAMEDFTIETVKVYANGSGDRTVELRDNNGTVLHTLTINMPDGESVVTLNFPVTIGTDFELGVEAGSNPDIFRNNAGANYPYDVAGVATITTSTAGSDYYYFFYDWQIKEADEGCVSERSDATVTVTAPNSVVNIDNIKSFDVYPNPSNGNFEVSFTIPVSSDVTVEVTNMIGQTVYDQQVGKVSGQLKHTLDLTSLAKGIYSLQIKAGDQVSSKKIVIN